MDDSDWPVHSESAPAPAEPGARTSVVAAFDVDGTLTRRDTLLPFLWRVAGPLQFVGYTIRLLPVLLRYALGQIPNGKAKERVLGQFLGGRSVAEIERVARAFATETLPRLLRTEALERLRWHRRKGHRVVLVSASPELYLRPWAETEGIDTVLATRLSTEAGRLTGHFDGENCYGPEKRRRLRAAVPDLDDVDVYAYGNSRGDRELLDMADHAFYRSFGDVDDAEAKAPPTENGGSSSETEEGGLPSGWQKGLVGAVAGGMVLYLGLTVWSGAEEILQGLRAVSPFTLLGVLGLVLAGYFVRFGRWHWYMGRLGEAVPWTTNLRVFFASFALAATPGKAGESVKAYLLKTSSGVDPARSLAGLFTERFTDVFSVVLVIGAGLLLLPKGQWIVIGIGSVQLAGIAALQRPRWLRRAVLLPLAGGAQVRRWVRPVDRMLDDTSALLQPGSLFGGILLGGLPWIGEGIAMYLLFEALGASAIALHEAILIHAAATLFGAVTFLPGGLGGHEAVSVSLALLYGATRPQAVAATVLIRLLTLWFAVAIGLVVLQVVLARERGGTPDGKRQGGTSRRRPSTE